MRRLLPGVAVTAILLLSGAARAADSLPVDVIKDADKAQQAGDTAWMLVSTGLVLLMVPGLALFYGGMVRRKNVLGTMMHSMVALAIIGIQWVLFGYALAFGDSKGGWIGWSPEFLGLGAPDLYDEVFPGTNIPIFVHCMYQGMFAIITPALISGAFAERIRFGPYCLFIFLWATLVYDPLAHWVWAVAAKDGSGDDPAGWLGQMGALDFAGGTVVHIAAGFAGLAAILVLRKRIGYPEHAMHPNSMVLTLTGAGLLWFGWFGFNGGSALAASPLAGAALDGVAGRGGRGGPELDARRMVAPRQADRAGPGLRHRRRPGRRHAGVRLRHPAGRAGHRPDRRRRLLRRRLPQAVAQVRRLARRLRRPRRRRLPRGGADRRVRRRPLWHKAGSGSDIRPILGTLAVGRAAQVWVQFLAAAVGGGVLVRRHRRAGEGDRPDDRLRAAGQGRGRRPGPCDPRRSRLRPEPGRGDAGRAEYEPRPASVPPEGKRRFTVVVEGPKNGDLMHAWSELCQPGNGPPPAGVPAVYPYVTTVQGNRFRFRGGDPVLLRESLERLFRDRLDGVQIKTHVES